MSSGEPASAGVTPLPAIIQYLLNTILAIYVNLYNCSDSSLVSTVKTDGGEPHLNITQVSYNKVV